MLTLEEAKKIGRIVSSADGGCPVCIQYLLETLNRDFPQFSWLYDNDYTLDSDDVVKVTEQ